MRIEKAYLVLIALMTFSVSCRNTDESSTKTEKISMTGEELRARGKYLSIVGGCNDCHSPKVMTPEGPLPDTTRLLSGHPESEVLPKPPSSPAWVYFNPSSTAFVGPWGISYAANLTPDETGIGNWTLNQFKTALRKGKYKGLQTARQLLPPMPWQNYREMTDTDMEALFAYLKSIPAIKNNVPPAVAPPLADTREMKR